MRPPWAQWRMWWACRKRSWQQPGKRHVRSRLRNARRKAGGRLRVFRPNDSGRPSRSRMRTTLASRPSHLAVSGARASPLEPARAVLVVIGKRGRVDVHDQLMLAPARPGRAVGERRLGHQDQRVGVEGVNRSSATGSPPGSASGSSSPIWVVSAETLPPVCGASPPVHAAHPHRTCEARRGQPRAPPVPQRPPRPAAAPDQQRSLLVMLATHEAAPIALRLVPELDLQHAPKRAHDRLQLSRRGMHRDHGQLGLRVRRRNPRQRPHLRIAQLATRERRPGLGQLRHSPRHPHLLTRCRWTQPTPIRPPMRARPAKPLGHASRLSNSPTRPSQRAIAALIWPANSAISRSSRSTGSRPG